MNEKLVNEIEKSVSGKKIKYVRSELSKSLRTVTLYFNCSAVLTEEEKKSIEKIVKSYLPQSFGNVNIVVNKIIVLEEFVKKEIVKYLNLNHKITCSSVKEEDISASIYDTVKVNIKLESAVYDFFNENNVCAELKSHLENVFVNDFEIFAENTGRLTVDAEKLRYIPKESEMQVNYRRELKVRGVTTLFDDDDTDTAYYIADCRDYIGVCHLAGVVTNIREQQSKNGKTYFIIDFSDKTANASGVIFPNKDKIGKIKKLSAGSEIIVYGEYGMRENFHNLRILSINLCEFPKNFIPAERPKRPCPKEYSLIFPKDIVIETQTSLFDVKETPAALEGRSFVIFDFETTGTEFDDKIIEIGAVKLVDGKFTQYFETLINPEQHITNDIVKLTGINDEMVREAPRYEDVCGDFYKFCYGSTIVTHNIEFDYRFLSNQSKPLDYNFDNPQLDTLLMARESIFGVANYKLNTLCDKFGITFDHHRAYSDALATGKLFIEIARIKKELP